MSKSFLESDVTTEKYFNWTTKAITSRFINNLYEELKSQKPETVLDIGCGTGYITNIIRKELNLSIVGSDLNFERISFAQKNFCEEVCIADIMKLPFRDNSFDKVIASEIIEHICSPETALKEINRVSKRYAIITVPHEPYFRIGNFLRAKHIASFGNPLDHINHYNKKTFRKTLQPFFSSVDIKNNALFWMMGILEK